ncbi:MAG: hypothetical protein RBU23_00075 [Candidatus Auribacterota bacterium]|jgi:hypothetical protein|nr:hypothetical protein [Candidatus Auribacterota bacterium]
MGLREKIRMLGIVIITIGLLCIPIGLAFSSETSSLFARLTDADSVGGLGAYFSAFGVMLLIISCILPDAWVKH